MENLVVTDGSKLPDIDCLKELIIKYGSVCRNNGIHSDF